MKNKQQDKIATCNKMKNNKQYKIQLKIITAQDKITANKIK